MSKEIEDILMPFFCEAFATNSKTYKYIDKVYNQNPSLYHSLASKHSCYDYTVCREMSITQEIYYKKILGILLDVDTCMNNPDFSAIIIKGWKYLISYLDNNLHNNEIDLKDFVFKLLRKYGVENLSDNEINANMTIMYGLSVMNGWKIVDNGAFPQFQEMIYNRIRHYRKENRLNVNNVDKNLYADMNTVKKKFEKLYFPIRNINGLDNIVDRKNSNSNFLNSLYLVFDEEELAIENLSMGIKFNSNDFNELILAYIISLSDKDFENIDYKDLMNFVIAGTHIKYLCRAYKQAKKIYFENTSETLEKQVEDNKKQQEANELLIQKLKAKNELLERELVLKEKENKRLKDSLSQMEDNKPELVALRNFVFNLHNDNIIEESTSVDYSKIEGVFIGGHTSLQDKLREVLVNVKFIGMDNINFNENVLKGNIFIYTDYLSHALYYKVMSIVNKNNLPVYYIKGNTNIDLILKQMGECI